MSYGKIGLTTVAVTQDLLSGMPLVHLKNSSTFGRTPPGGSGWIISVGEYADNSFAALGSSNPREVRLKL